jgi:competence protein ComEC
VDTLVISHADNDHRGGAESVLQSYPDARVLSSAPALPFANETCARGARWHWDEVEFEVLHPVAGEHARGNDHSCVLMIRSRFGSVLLPGDIETRAEMALLAGNVGALRAEVLVAPHHGSKTSSHPGFIAAVRPQQVLLPVGYRNRYRHPHPAVVARYAEAGALLSDSPRSGAIELRLDARGIHRAAYRDTAARYWFAP